MVISLKYNKCKYYKLNR